jgi:N-carbamoylputrescine amidase
MYELGRDAANQRASNYVTRIIQQPIFLCQSEDVDNSETAEPLYSTSFIAFSALAKELEW